MSPTQTRTVTLALILCLGGALAAFSAANKPTLSSTVTSYALDD